MSSARTVSPLAPKEAELLERRLKEASGILLANGIRSTLSLSVHSAAKSAGLGAGEFIQRVIQGEPASVRLLVEYCSIKETYFFRHPEQFDALRETVIPQLRRRPELCIWSAACSTGEEPYSIAMALLEEHLTSARVIATDIAETALEVARRGVYPRGALRRIRRGNWQKYFEESTQVRQSVVVKPEVRRLVEFRQMNLVSDAPPTMGCHIVFCRNVLIYFAPATAQAVLQKMWNVLIPGGFLVLGAVEVAFASALNAESLTSGQATLLRKPMASGMNGARSSTPEKPVPSSSVSNDSYSLSRAPRPGPLPGLVTANRRFQATPETSVPAESAVPGGEPGLFERACEAARRGDLFEAERLAELAANALLPESFLILSMAAESRGDLQSAVDALKRALYLNADLVIAHATLVALFQRLGETEQSERSRRNALRILSRLDDTTELKAVESITAGSLRRALVKRGAKAP